MLHVWDWLHDIVNNNPSQSYHLCHHRSYYLNLDKHYHRNGDHQHLNHCSNQLHNNYYYHYVYHASDLYYHYFYHTSGCNNYHCSNQHNNSC